MNINEIFISWIKDKKLPPKEIDKNLATQEKLVFNNHESQAVEKDFIDEKTVESAFDLVQRAIKNSRKYGYLTKLSYIF